MRFLGRLFKKSRETRVSSRWNDFRFPFDIQNPAAACVFSSPGVSGAWSAVYMVRALQEAYKGKPVHLVVHRDFAEMAGFLPWAPAVHTFSADSGETDPPVPDGSLLFSTEPGDALLRFVERNEPIACVSSMEHPAVNIQVRTETRKLPDSVAGVMTVLDLGCYENWTPVTPRGLSERASEILSPVSHRTLPYILATEAAAALLEKRRAEIPLKVVLADGKKPGVPPDTSHGLMAAIVAGASAVITTEPHLWIHSVALGIPVVGLDRKDLFSAWGEDPARGDTQFIEQWAGLIRRGW